MQSRHAAVALSFMLLATMARAAPPDASSLPTLDAIRAMYDAGKFAEAIASGQRLLAARDASAEPRHAVRMLIVESQLRLKRPGQAIETLKAAAGERGAAPADVDEANALMMLVRASPSLAYAPTTGDGRAPVDIVAPERRQLALARLFDDRLAACKTLQAASTSAKTLAPLAKLATAYADVRTLAHVTPEATDASVTLGKELSGWALKVTDQALDHANEEVTRVAKNVTVDDDGGQHRVGRRGELDSGQIASLKQVAADCEKVPAVVDGLAKAFAEPAAAEASTTKAHATSIVDRVRTLLEANDRVQQDIRRNGRGRRY